MEIWQSHWINYPYCRDRDTDTVILTGPGRTSMRRTIKRTAAIRVLVQQLLVMVGRGARCVCLCVHVCMGCVSGI